MAQMLQKMITSRAMIYGISCSPPFFIALAIVLLGISSPVVINGLLVLNWQQGITWTNVDLGQWLNYNYGTRRALLPARLHLSWLRHWLQRLMAEWHLREWKRIAFSGLYVWLKIACRSAVSLVQTILFAAGTRGSGKVPWKINTPNDYICNLAPV